MTVSPEDQASVDASRAPLIEHLIELRSRVIKMVIAVAIGFIGCYVVAEYIYAFLVNPYAELVAGEEGRRLIFTAPQEAFFTYIKVAFWGGVIVAFPILAFQIYAFVAPGLYKHERLAFLPFLAATPVLFTAGASLVYFGVMPLALQFFLGFEHDASIGGLPIQLEAKVNEYLSLVMTLIFAFGLCFQLPVLLTLLARVGIIDSAWLKKNRKYAVILVFVAAAVLTPPDPVSQLGLAIPILLLYEISIWSARLVERKREQADASDQSNAPDQAS